MAVEVGDRYKSVSSFGTIWIVKRLIDGPRMVPHAILVRIDDRNSTRTVSVRALAERHLFERVPATAG